MQPLDFNKLGFNYVKTPARFVAEYKNGAWSEGALTEEENLVVNESACVFQYAQTCFEGLKAYTTADGRKVCFRPDLNAARMADSCRRLMMPVFPEDRFVEAVKMTVAANRDYIPPYETGASLYVRPFMIGTSPILAVMPASEFQFRIFTSPVGPYFKGGVRPLKLRVSGLDRAAPRGTGNIKAGLNYAMSLYVTMDAHECGYDENVYLDPGSRTYIEETGGANVLFVTRDGKVVTPQSDSILPSITRRSLMYVAKEYLGLETEERRIALDELGDFAECGLCGTAAVISPVGSITDGERTFTFTDEANPMGKTIQKLYDTLRGIQLGAIEAPEGWIVEV